MIDTKTKQSDATGDVASTITQAPRKKPFRLLIVISCIAIIAALAGIAGCQPQGNSGGSAGTSMNDFVKTYEADHGAGDSSHLVTAHDKLGYECLDCHESTDTTNMGTRETCLASCHDEKKIIAATNDYAGLYARGISTGFKGLDEGLNPHRSHMEYMQCGDCHQMHQPSVMDCNECHYIPLPEGWTDVWNGVGSTKLDK